MQATLEDWLIHLAPDQEIVCTKKSYWNVRDRIRALRRSHSISLKITTEEETKVIRRA